MFNKRVYLDHAGATLPSTAHLNEVAANLTNLIFLANPHSRNQSGQNSAAIIKQIREKILEFFGVDSEKYSVVFTKNATDGIRIAVESIDQLFRSRRFQNPSLALFQDSHTSVHGIRQRLADWKVQIIKSVLQEDLSKIQADFFIFTAMSNFCGKKYSPKIIENLKASNSSMISLVDLSALCGTSPVNLKNYDFPEFAVLSFYKIFGYPTGIGALLIKKTKLFEEFLFPVGFSGGNVNKYDVETGQFYLKKELEDRFEFGTPDYHGIAILKYGFDDIQRFGGMAAVQDHTFGLASMAYEYLRQSKHSNGKPVAKIYGWENPKKWGQGPIVNFNLIRNDGTFVGYSEVEKMCDLFDIEIRTGCFCNQGACDSYLELKNDGKTSETLEIKKCGDEFDIFDGKPLGSCRISFGRTSTVNDLDIFKQMIETCFVSAPNLAAAPKNPKKFDQRFGILTDLFFYPIKSCGAASSKKWRLTSSGLWLDRQWMLVSSDGIVLTQKKLPILCSVLPKITENNTLLLSSENRPEPFELPLELSTTESKIEASVCINNFQAIDCGKSASEWFHGLHPTIPDNLKLLRLLDLNCNNDQSKTFNNVADYLLITWASIRNLANLVNLPSETVRSRFRANFVIESGSDVPFDEDNYKRIWIGGIGFEVISRCTRCQMIAIDQKTGQKDPNVLLALRNLRFGDKIAFGVYLQKMTTNAVEISVGSTVKIDR